MNAERAIFSPAQIVGAIGQAYSTMLLSERTPAGKRPYVYASAHRECDRRMVLEMVEGDKLPPWPADVLANFRRGNDRERDLLTDLRRVGRMCDTPFEVVKEQERFELRDRKGRVAIVGKVDARLKFSDGTERPLECKAWSENIVSRVERFEDLFNIVWTRSGAYQLLAYLLGSNEPYGFMLLDRRGLPLLLPVSLYDNLERIESFLSRAEAALDHAAAGTLPDFHDEAAECKRCPFYGSTCNPPLAGRGAAILTDPELEAMLARREVLKAAALEYDDLDAEVKAKLRGVEQGIAGSFLITGRWGASTKYEIPPEIKKQYERKDPHGRFTLMIEKIA